KPAHRHLLVAHLTGLLGSFEGAGCVCRAAGLWLTMDHRAVRHIASMEMVALDNACEPFSFGGACHLDTLARLKNIARDGVTEFVVAGVFGADLAQMAEWFHPRLLEMPRFRFVDKPGADLTEP